MKKPERKEKPKKRHFRRQRPSSYKSFVTLTVLAAIILTSVFGIRIAEKIKGDQVYASSKENQSTSADNDGVDYSLPTGIAGVASGVNATLSAGTAVTRFGTSCEDVMVGQRTQTVTGGVVKMDVSASMESAVNAFDEKTVSLASSAKIMSDEDYQNLLNIVEAEAGTEDLKGRILVANVIMNRVNYSEFPDTVSDVIWEYKNGVAQFSPVADGRINTVTASDETKEAVRQALNGTDYSEGALFFIQKSAAEKKSVEWFEKNLKKLFKHGVHEFYTYSDETTDESTENTSGETTDKTKDVKSEEESKSDESVAPFTSASEIVQMVKAE